MDKFGKTVSVVEWMVYLNNSLLASETSHSQTICKMTDGSRLQKTNTRNASLSLTFPLDHWGGQPVLCVKSFPGGPLSAAGRGKWYMLRGAFVCYFTNGYIPF